SCGTRREACRCCAFATRQLGLRTACRQNALSNGRVPASKKFNGRDSTTPIQICLSRSERSAGGGGLPLPGRMGVATEIRLGMGPLQDEVAHEKIGAQRGPGLLQQLRRGRTPWPALDVALAVQRGQLGLHPQGPRRGARAWPPPRGQSAPRGSQNGTLW